MNGFRVVDVATGREIGTAMFDGGRWDTSSTSVARMVSAKTAGLGWSPAQVLAFYESWSNGYVQTVGVGGGVTKRFDPHELRLPAGAAGGHGGEWTHVGAVAGSLVRDVVPDQRRRDEETPLTRLLETYKATTHPDGTVDAYWTSDKTLKEVREHGHTLAPDGRGDTFFSTQKPRWLQPGQHVIKVRLPLEHLELFSTYATDDPDVRSVSMRWDHRGKTVDLAQYVTEPEPREKPTATGAYRFKTRQDIDALVRETPASRSALTGGVMGETSLETFDDGSELVHKRYPSERKIAAEYLASRIGEAVGARVPAVVLNPADPNSCYLDYIDGDVAHSIYRDAAIPRAVVESDDGLRLGLLDALIGNGDRHNFNWIIAPDGRPVGIDHGESFGHRDWAGRSLPLDQPPDLTADYPGFTPNFFAHGRWHDNDLHPDDVALIRERVAALRGEFERLGVPEWHDMVMARLDAIGEHAVGETRVIE